MSRLQAPRRTGPLVDDTTDAPRSRVRSLRNFILPAAIVVALDQLTKQWVLSSLGTTRKVDVIDGALTIHVTLNPGGAFGLGRSFPGLFLVATVAIVTVLLLVARRTEDSAWLVPLGLVLGGGLGNLSDRVFRSYEGRVVDFVDFHVWPVFNVADSAIVIGVVLMLFLSFRARR